ncbi:MAG: hypothetical protein WAZ18_04705 [Alphaproteobacteria bacterium]
MTTTVPVTDIQIQALIDGARDLLSKLPTHAHVIGIGNSPSWLLYTAEMIAKDQNLENISFANLPFSGKALYELEGCWHSESDLSENDIIQQHFNKHKYTPSDLLEKEKPLVFVDYLESANGAMTPIVALMHQAAREDRLDDLKSRISTIINIGPDIEGKRRLRPITRVMTRPYADPFDDILLQPVKDGSHPDILNIPCTNLSRDFYTEIGIDCSKDNPGSRLVPSFYPPGTTGVLHYQTPDLDFIRDVQQRISCAVRGKSSQNNDSYSNDLGFSSRS